VTEAPATGPLTHGFLFADLRGYTAFAETRGDVAAADLLDRYRGLVREVLAELGGAEIKTEGDSFYVVFPSASRAVAAGLAIVARTLEATPTSPASITPVDPIRVGIGIHAGEAEERAEGYVGTAVNIAARVCAQARPGEVLVTETVRALTRTSGRYRFIARGRPSLKGITEPIALFAAEEATAIAPAPPARTPKRGVVAGIAAVIAVAVIGAAVLVGPLRPYRAGTASQSSGLSPGLAGPSVREGVASASLSSSSAVPGPQPFHTGPLAAGTYATTVMKPPIQFSVPEGWSGFSELPNFVEIDLFKDEREQLILMFPSVGYVPCSTTEFVTLPSRREDLAAWLLANRGLSVHVTGTLGLGDAEAQELEVGLGDGCQGQAVQPLFLIQNSPNGTNGDDRWVVTPGPAAPIYLIDAGGRTLVGLVGSPPSKLDAFKVDARTVLSSLDVSP
jgi:class 3 adenylate cyclase